LEELFMAKTINVMIIDDSAVVRQTLVDILSSDPHIKVMATATDPFDAAERLREGIPDVITLDVEMPRMDGITFLKKLMLQHPIPVVMCSSLTEKGSDLAFQALEAGAVEIIQKPKLGTMKFLVESQVRICDAVKAAAQARVRKLGTGKGISSVRQTNRTIQAVVPSKATGEKVVVIGASTGGTEALKVFLESLPADSPGILIVQHMPEKFTATFARRLNGICRVNVKEAADGDAVARGQVLIAPGNHHARLKQRSSGYFVDVTDGPLVSRHRPSVDVLFGSAAEAAGENAIGIILTGMGDDGAKGMLVMKKAGAATIAQDEESCVVFGMPKEAIKLGAVDQVLSLETISEEVIKVCSQVVMLD
jgi:two-component system chemotaxis response regulator CheB